MVRANDVLVVDELTEMEFKNATAKYDWEELVNKNSKNSCMNMVKFARRWAKFMQYLMNEQGKTFSKAAECALTACAPEGISGLVYGASVVALSKSWKYGEELRRWHNNQVKL